MVTIRIPAPPRGAVSNALGLAGVTGLAVASGGLVGNWWLSGLVASLVLIGMAAVAHYGQADEHQAVDVPAAAPNAGVDQTRAERRRPHDIDLTAGD
ncbi:MAG: hypothetical protein K0Q93_2149 [Nocardioidaceae bacterium]|nr:hypothetical protein [Nocardioidaceae bacterium]